MLIDLRPVPCIGRPTGIPLLNAPIDKRCRPARHALPSFRARPGELKFGPIFSTRHAILYLDERATDCEVKSALCAVGGDLASFTPLLRMGAVSFPWVENADELKEAMELLRHQPGVEEATLDWTLHLEE